LPSYFPILYCSLIDPSVKPMNIDALMSGYSAKDISLNKFTFYVCH